MRDIGVKVQKEICDENIVYKILPVKDIDLAKLTKKVVEILELLSYKFKDLRAKEIVEYMRVENVYKITKPNQFISYDVANELNELE